jgi:hypothetical protein
VNAIKPAIPAHSYPVQAVAMSSRKHADVLSHVQLQEKLEGSGFEEHSIDSHSESDNEEYGTCKVTSQTEHFTDSFSLEGTAKHLSKTIDSFKCF